MYYIEPPWRSVKNVYIRVFGKSSFLSAPVLFLRKNMRHTKTVARQAGDAGGKNSAQSRVLEFFTKKGV